MCPSQTTPRARKRKVIAWKRCGSENHVRNFPNVQFMHVTQNKLIGIAEMIAIHLVLVFVNVIGKNNSPSGLFQSEPHQADAREKFAESF